MDYYQWNTPNYILRLIHKKIKLSLWLIKHHAMKMYGGEEV
jgi:hypothetical protein